jgi:hypothetical protein
LAYYQVTGLSAVKGISGGNGRVALIQALAQNVRWRDDGTNPTSTVGMRLAAGETMFYVGDLRKIRFIEEAASAELNLSVYE